MANALIGAVTVGYLIDALIVVAFTPGAVRGARLITYCCCTLLAGGLLLAVATGGVKRWPAWLRGVLVLVECGTTLAPLFWVGPLAGSMLGFSAGLVLLLIDGRARWFGFAAVGGAVLWAFLGTGLDVDDSIYAVYFTLLTGVVLYSISSLGALGLTLHSARYDLVRMAVLSERTRLARDVHDLLGLNLSALLMKTELAFRVVTVDPQRARREVRETLAITRETLGSIREVARNESSPSLAREISSAKTVLADADVSVHTEVARWPACEQVDGVLAVVVREATTNILRHARASSASISLAAHDEVLVLRIENDGVGLPEPALRAGRRGAGLNNLTGRLALVGGLLDVQHRGGRFEITATTPLHQPMGAREQGDGVTDIPPARTAQTVLALRTALLLTTIVTVGYGVLLVINQLAVLPETDRTFYAALVFFGVLMQVGLQLRIALVDRYLGMRQSAGLLAALAAVSFAPLLWTTGPWGSMAGFLAGSLRILIGGRWRWIGYAMPILVVLALVTATTGELAQIVYLVISSALTGLILFGVSRLSRLVSQIESYRAQRARLAVMSDRYRADKELDEFMRRDLTTIVALFESAHELLSFDPGGARQRLTDVLVVARRIVANVRSVADASRAASFPDELRAAVGVLTDAGVKVTLNGTEDVIPTGLEDSFAVALRNQVETIIDSGAARCSIGLSRKDNSFVLSVAAEADLERLRSRLPVLRGRSQRPQQRFAMAIPQGDGDQ